MNLLVIHLTDVHLSAETSNFIERANSIIDAALSPVMELDEIHLLISGDITNQGLPEEFTIASNFINLLARRINERANLSPLIVLTAGNHDCDFSGDQSLREIVVQGVRNSPTSISPLVSEQLSSVLNGFYQFQLSEMKAFERLNPWTSIVTTSGSNPIHYILLDSSVLSIKKEETGKLYVPIPQNDFDPCRTIYVMHHPYGWLQPDNARELGNI